MNQITKDYITESNGKYTVHGHTGRSFGTYPTRAEAEKRLRQIEYFKHAGDQFKSVSGRDMSEEEMTQLQSLMDKFFSEEKKEPEHKTQDVAKVGAGIVFQTPTGRVLLLRRVETEPNYGGYWALPGGKALPGESPADAAMREAREETGFSDDFDVMRDLGTVPTPNGFEFTTYLVKCHEEFKPVFKDKEHDDHQWASLDNLPAPIHPGVEKVLSKLKVTKSAASDKFTFDKESVRSIDAAGRMHVAVAHISKATVNPYYGHEIPDFEELNLDPNKLYHMFRDPAELEKAAGTFNGIQLLLQHTPVSADDHRPDEIAGTTGTTAEFNDPYLDNELIIWSQEGIDLVQSGLQQELSCGYGYKPVMEAGVFKGMRYDGRMTDIEGNHVALVSKGRAGPDVVVGDEAIQLEKETNMTKPLSRTAVRVQAALSAFFLPKLAMDSRLKFSTALATGLSQIGDTEKVTRKALEKKNFKDAIIKLAKDTATPLLTPEALKQGLGTDELLMSVLDMIGDASKEDDEEGKEDDDHAGDNHGADRHRADDDHGGDTSAPMAWCDSIYDALKDSGMDEASAGRIRDMIPEEFRKKAKDTATPQERLEEVAKAKQAAETMDAALKAARDGAVADTMKKLTDIREAERKVAPLIGEVSVATDSAEEIYKAALKANDVSIEGVHPSAYPALVDMLVRQKSDAAGSTARKIVSDSASNDDRAAFDKQYGIETRQIQNFG